MPVPYCYRGRIITQLDIVFLRQFIAEHSHLSRRRLSAKVCEAWDWRQANGALRDMVCRGLLLMLHRAGEIELPEVRFVARNPFIERDRPAPVLIDTTPVIAALHELRPLEVQQVRRTGDEPLFNSLVEYHHYLGNRVYQERLLNHHRLGSHAACSLPSASALRFSSSAPWRAAIWSMTLRFASIRTGSMHKKRAQRCS